VTEEIKWEPFARDCLKVAEKMIVDLHLIDRETLQSWRDEASAKVEEAITTAQKEPAPDGGAECWSAISTRELVDLAE
jgi:TPP-dependent pyruvate/acetoin dehydrogenase alpha subunit